MQQISHDVLIFGTGLAGLRAAVEICIRTKGAAKIGIVSKVQVMRSHSVCAEGGTAAVMRPDTGAESTRPADRGSRKRIRPVAHGAASGTAL